MSAVDGVTFQEARSPRMVRVPDGVFIMGDGEGLRAARRALTYQ